MWLFVCIYVCLSVLVDRCASVERIEEGMVGDGGKEGEERRTGGGGGGVGSSSSDGSSSSNSSSE